MYHNAANEVKIKNGLTFTLSVPDPTEYISFYGLRTHEELLGRMVSVHEWRHVYMVGVVLKGP